MDYDCINCVNSNYTQKCIGCREKYPPKNFDTKPPLGVMPESIFLEKRIIELKRAIKEYVDYGRIEVNLLTGWIKELEKREKELKEVNGTL